MLLKRAIPFALPLICCMAPTGASAEWRTENLAGMRVHLYVPASPRALLVALHGCTQSPDALRDRGKFEASAEAHRALIALPAVPGGGVLAGCWDYYGEDHAIDTRHHGPLIALVETLLSSFALDANRVYLIGLSSGAGEAAVLGCLAPDRFAGIGINAGPAVGTDASEFSVVSTDRDTASALCLALAGSRAGGFATQLTSVIHGANDFVVAQGYARLNAEIMAEVYRGDGAALIESSLDVTALPGTSPRGEGAIWSDAIGPRVSLVVVDGMGHAFPAGEGDGLETSFVAQKGVAWPAYVLDFFEANNRRIDRMAPSDAGVPSDGVSQPKDSGAENGEDPPFERDPEAGCACSSTNGEPSLLFVLVLSLVLRRRR